MTNESILETLKVQPLTEEEKQKRHILKRLTGPIASCKEGTRNGRKYNKTLWEQALNDEIFKEKVANKGLFLELGHPDREEIDMSCACACIPEIPKIIDDDLYAVVDVLDTPAGKILNTLIDYGFKPGISSRGTGDVIGDEVDPDTFILETWDIVNVPALEKARLSVTEGLDKNMLNLKKALVESLNSASDEDKKIMTETLNNLNINVSEEEKEEVNTEELTESVENKNVDKEETEQASIKEEAVTNSEANTLMDSLKESLKTNASLELKVKSLQEDLAVSDTKVGNLEEQLNNANSTIVRLTTLVRNSKELSKKITSLEESLESKEKIIADLKKQSLTENNNSKVINTLRESVSKKENSIREARSKINSLTEQLESLKKNNDAEIKSIKESFEAERSLTEKKISSLEEELAKANKQVAKYERHSNDIAVKYIETKAKLIGSSVNEVMSRLNDNYTLADVERVCEDLRRIRINKNKIPFAIDNGGIIKVKESKNIGMSETNCESSDDYVSDDMKDYVNRM